MEPVTFQGGAFSEYFCRKLLWTDPQLSPKLDLPEAERLYKRASSVFRQAQRQLDGKLLARSTYSQLLDPLAEILGWQLGEQAKIVTELEQEEEAGVPLLAHDRDKPLARAVCISPGAHLDAAPAGLHRRFAPTLSLARVLGEENLDYGLLLNAYELRLVCNVGTLPSYVGFDLTSIAEGTVPGLEAWKLLFSLLRQPALLLEPCLLDLVRKIGTEHQQSVSTLLGRQVQQAVVRFMQGVLDHPLNKSKLPERITDAFLHDLYQETLRLLYRLLFCLYAEDLNLLPIDVLTYREGYSLKRLILLAKGQTSDSLEAVDPNGSFFQESLQALFALLRTGCHLGPEGSIQPYGGGLFNQSGTALIDTLAWGNATVDNVLELLTRLPAPKGQTGFVQLSYRELNVEQLGSIYEGLLEQTPAYAPERRWKAELDSRIIVIDDANRERIRELRDERLASDELGLSDETEAVEDGTDDESQTDDETAEAADEEQPPRQRSAKKPLKILAEIPARTVYLKGGLGRKQSGSYYTNRAFVDFLVREALEPQAEGKSSQDILSLRVVDPAMGSGHFLVGACRKLAEHLLAAYRREVARVQAEDKQGQLSEDDLLTLAEVPPELVQVWNSADQERELAVCRLLVAGNCIYGVDKNPLAVDLAKVALWLVTAASRMPLSFLDHRLRCGDSLLGIPAEEVVRPWIAPTPKTGKKGGVKKEAKTVKPVELLISPKHGQETFDYLAPSGKALCQSFTRAFACLGQLLERIQADPSNFEEHRARHAALRGTLEPWWQVHELRVGLAFEPAGVDPQVLNEWLEDLLEHGRVQDEHRVRGEGFRQRGQQLGAFCWELAFPEVFYRPDGQRREDAGFSCVLGNPPWDKIKPERDAFYLAYDPLIRQFQGTQKNRRIEELHRDQPAVEAAWRQYEYASRRLSEVLLDGGIYAHQTAVVEEEVEGDDGEPLVKKMTTGGDPDCFKFFLERAWQLAATGRTVGMVMSSSLHNAEGCTGLRRLLLNECHLRTLVKFDNEMRVFPGVHNQFKFDLIVFTKSMPSRQIDVAFFSRERAEAIQRFRSHRVYLRIEVETLRKINPQTLKIPEMGGQSDSALVAKAFRGHAAFGNGAYAQLRLRYATEIHMTNGRWFFRDRIWLRRHGCRRVSGEEWVAAPAAWYESRDYVARRVVEWFVLFKDKKARAYRLPWPVKSASKISLADLEDFDLRCELPDGYEFFGKSDDRTLPERVYVAKDEVKSTDLPFHVFGMKDLGPFSMTTAIAPDSRFLPLLEGKNLFQFSYCYFAFVSGGGNWVITRPTVGLEDELIPQFFVGAYDAKLLRRGQGPHVGFRDVSGSSDERTGMAAIVPPPIVSSNKVGLLTADSFTELQFVFLVCWINSFAFDFFLRLASSATVNLHVLKSVPCPRFDEASAVPLARQVARLFEANSYSVPTTTLASSDLDIPAYTMDLRSMADAWLAEQYEFTPLEYAYVLSTFPLLDRDQPPLPHDCRIRPTNKGIDRRPISFITRDLALLTYFDYLAGRLEIKPDPDRVARICPEGVPEPPTDIVQFFAEAGVDIAGRTEYAVAATGPFRDLRERVAKARELGAVAYVPTIDRRRATFVERAAAAGGLTPEEGVLTPDMAAHVLREKAAREAKWQRAMELWDATPAPYVAADETRDRGTAPVSVDAPAD